jgi:Protein of unknown function DUF262/Protein of unknown function (DUF1524)
MSSSVRVSAVSVEELFGRDRVIHLPWFQRAYAWREDNAIRLLTDILSAMNGGSSGYSLGHVYLAGVEGASSVAIIDGHQRAMTLALMFAILRDITGLDAGMKPDVRAALITRLQNLIEMGPQPSGPRAQWAPAPIWRLTTQAQLSPLFERYVQLPGATFLAPTEDLGVLSNAERNVIANRDKLHGALALGQMTTAERTQLIQFLLSGCNMIVVEVDDEDQAWSMLGVEQTTRLPHDAGELSKISLIQAMPQVDQSSAGLSWERAQAQLDDGRMSELLIHLRTAKIERRSCKPIDADILRLYDIQRNGLGFINGVLLPAANALSRIDQRRIGTGTLSTQITRHLDALSWLDHRQWVAPAIAWLTQKSDQHPDTGTFFAQLDRFAWLLRLAGTDPNEQESRFIKLTLAITNSQPPGSWKEFTIEPRLIEDALIILRSRTFYFKHMSHPILRRLCAILGQESGQIDGVKVSVEHVLPRKPPSDRRWTRDFKSLSGISDHTDRLGNLALLTGPQNRKADTNDWPVKQGILGASGFALSLEAAANIEWMPRTIEARTEKLIKLLFTTWELPIELLK